jgi:hypothetical protein
MFGKGRAMAHEIITDKGKKKHRFKATDHFGGETRYFSNCVLRGINPEPNGEEGYCDVRVIEAIRRSLETGQVQHLAPYQRIGRIEMNQKETLKPTKPYRYVNCSNPTEG